MPISFSPEQWRDIERLARTHPNAHVRSRASAVRAVMLGHTRQEVSGYLPFSAYSIGQWVQAFRRHGAAAFQIAAGRGRVSNVDTEDVLAHLRRSPYFFGVQQSRWTLKALGRACPSLQGMTERGILNVLHRLGFSYKRGQPWIHSPDPQYEEKKTPSRRPTAKPKKTQEP